MKKLYLLLASLLVLAAVFPLFAGGGRQQSGGPVSLTFVNWVSAEEATQADILSVIKAFETANPGITINNQGIAFSDIVQELTIRSTAGNAPDISQINSDNIGQIQAAGFLTPLDSLLTPSFVSNLFPDVYNAVGLIDGKHWAVPWANATQGMFYNRELMIQAGLDPNKLPRTMDELTEMIRTAKQKLPDDIIMIQIDTTVRTIGLFCNWPFMLAFNNGVAPYTLDGKVNYNTPGMKAYMEWIRMLVNEKYTLPGMRMGQFRPYAAQNKLLIGNDWTTFDGIVRSMDETKRLTPEVMYKTWAVGPMPAGRDGVSRTPVSAHTLALFQSSKNKEAGIKFLEFLVSSQTALDGYIGKNGFTPVTKDAISKCQALQTSEFIAGFVKDVVPASVSMPTGPDYGLYAEVIMTGVQEVITTNRSIDDILADGQRKLEALFK
jgi:multiple sugar transport system substrate-binding protein